MNAADMPPVTPSEVQSHNTDVARDAALRILVVALADPAPERDTALAQMIDGLLATGPTPTARTLGAITACAVNALAANHGSRAAATDTILAAIAENHGGPLLCPMDLIPCPSPTACVIAQRCHRPGITMNSEAGRDQ